jgi:hypothetical protein
VLHHPEYRERYAANLKRELPRIPFVGSAERGTIVAQDVSPGSAVINEVGVPSGTTQKAGPSTLGRDDTSGNGSDRGPSTRAGALAQDDTIKNRDDKSEFWAFVKAGRDLADLHVNYEQQQPYPLEHLEKVN